MKIQINMEIDSQTFECAAAAEVVKNNQREIWSELERNLE